MPSELEQKKRFTSLEGGWTLMRLPTRVKFTISPQMSGT